MKQPTGYIIHRGPSRIDGSPIVVVAILGSSNRKTGDLVQTYIMPAGLRPSVAARIGADRAVCGDCPHRPANNGTCYVVLGQGPTVVSKGLARGLYPYDPEAARDACKGRKVRLGTWGDPAAVPFEVWADLLTDAAGRAGYTHQWRRADFDPRILTLCMASADGADDAAELRAQGIRYFRVRASDEPIARGEIMCPASEEAGKKRQCADCLACDGTDRPGKVSVSIIAHGAKHRRFIPVRAA